MTRLMAAQREHIDTLHGPDLWAHLRESHRMPDELERRLYIPDGYGYQYRGWHEKMHLQEEQS